MQVPDYRVVILGAGVWLSHIGDAMATSYALEEGLVGTIFLAAVSSLPELVTGLAAVRAGLLALAAGSILGSNVFNLGILGVADLVHQSANQLELPAGPLEDALDALVERGRVVVRPLTGDLALYLPYLLRAEEEVLNEVAARVGPPAAPFVNDSSG